METDPDKRPDSSQNGAQSPAEPAAGPEEKRFNPFIHEADMFKVVLWAGGIAVVVILLVVLLGAIV
jgi:hypothetical protein